MMMMMGRQECKCSPTGLAILLYCILNQMEAHLLPCNFTFEGHIVSMIEYIYVANSCLAALGPSMVRRGDISPGAMEPCLSQRNKETISYSAMHPIIVDRTNE